MKLLIRCGIQQERISECMDWVKTHAGRNPARALSSAFFFGRLKRQATSANTVKSPVAKKDDSPRNQNKGICRNLGSVPPPDNQVPL